MALDRSELSSIAQMLNQLTSRITSMAEAAYAEHDETSSTELFSVERTLQGANRRLERVLSSRR